MKRLNGFQSRRPSLTGRRQQPQHLEEAPDRGDRVRMVEEMRDSIAREVGPFLGGLR